MPVASATFTVALIGNPNTGKSTLFNALCGVRQRVGNYPGVTVEKKVGSCQVAGSVTDSLRESARSRGASSPHSGPAAEHDCQIIDLPGTYSLAPRSPDEMVAVDVLLGRREGEPPPDAVVCIVDAANLERNLYLVSQVLELGLPTIVALSMTDLAEQQGLKIDVRRLAERLGVPIVSIQAQKRRGAEPLKEAMAELIANAEFGTRNSELEDGNQQSSIPHSAFRIPNSTGLFPPDFQREVATVQAAYDERSLDGLLPRFLAERLLLDVGGYLESRLLRADQVKSGDALRGELSAARQRLAAAGHAVPAVEAIARYRWIGEILTGVVERPRERAATVTDKIDRVLTHRVWGTAIFALLMAGVFSTIFLVADTPMGWIDAGIGWLQETVAGWMPEGALRSLIVDGVIAGVGAVVIFLPQILLLFFFIAVMEASGYMARAAYLMDKLMARVGLSGKSFIPLLSSFACAIPGIMAARVIENRRDRLTTILVAPLMSCSARLPVYIILIGAFIPTDTALGAFLPGLVLFSMYLIGIVTAVIVALILKKTLLKGPTPPFVMELPTYKFPSPGGVLHRMADRGWAFVRRAGTLIFAVTVVIWALGYYPQDDAAAERFAAQRGGIEIEIAELADGDPRAAALEERLAELDHVEQREHLQQSYLGRMGKAIEPAVKPLGWDWRIGAAAVASFPAREVVMSTLGVIYNLGGEIDLDEDAEGLHAQLQAATWDDSGEKVYNVPVALSIMVFFALCAQCASTLAVMKRETNSWRWPLFTFVYMTTLAYLGALVTYQVGMSLM